MCGYPRWHLLWVRKRILTLDFSACTSVIHQPRVCGIQLWQPKPGNRTRGQVTEQTPGGTELEKLGLMGCHLSPRAGFSEHLSPLPLPPAPLVGQPLLCPLTSDPFSCKIFALWQPPSRSNRNKACVSLTRFPTFWEDPLCSVAAPPHGTHGFGLGATGSSMVVFQTTGDVFSCLPAPTSPL